MKLLNKTKQDFAQWFTAQDSQLRYDLATTPLNAKTELARFRRRYIKVLNNRNLRSIRKGVANATATDD